MCSRNGLFNMGNIGLGVLQVRGRIRVPSPPTRITAFIIMLIIYQHYASQSSMGVTDCCRQAPRNSLAILLSLFDKMYMKVT